jgi:hypothetical protein
VSDTERGQLRVCVPELAWVADARDGSLCFVQGSQAPCAQFHPLGPTVLVDGDPLDVRLPLAFGAYVRVANIVSERWSLAALFTFRHDCISPTQIEPACCSAGPTSSGLRRISYHKGAFSASQVGADARDAAKSERNRVSFPWRNNLLRGSDGGKAGTDAVPARNPVSDGRQGTMQ